MTESCLIFADTIGELLDWLVPVVFFGIFFLSVATNAKKKAKTPTARSRTEATKFFTTRKLTSASRSAMRTSLSAASTSFSESLPLPRRLLNILLNFSVRDSKAIRSYPL